MGVGVGVGEGGGGGDRLSRSVNCHARSVRAAVKNSHAAARHQSGGCKLRVYLVLLGLARQLASDPNPCPDPSHG